MQRSKQNTASPIKEMCWDYGSCPRLYCWTCLFCSGSFVEVASADKPAGNALPDISVNGLTDHLLNKRLSRVRYMGSILHVPRWGSGQLNTLLFHEFWNRRRDHVAFYTGK